MVRLATAALILAPVAVAVHRLILLEQTTGGIISLRPAHTLRYFIWVFIFELCSRLVGLLQVGLAPLLTNVLAVARLTIALAWISTARNLPNSVAANRFI